MASQKPPTVREQYQGRFFKIDSFMAQQLREARQARAADTVGCCSFHACCGSAEGCVRCCRLMRFMVTSLASLTLAVGPWVVSTAELTAMLCYYFLAVPNALGTKQHFVYFRLDFYSRVEDVVVISLARGLAVFLAYFFGTGKHYQRPYLYAAIAFAIIGVPYAGSKMVLFHYPPINWLPFLVLMSINLGYSIFHLFTAQRVMIWAKRRYHMGLQGFGYPWQVGEDAWVMHHNYKEAGTNLDTSDADVDPEQLADADSRFINIGRVRIHYKLWETRVLDDRPPSRAAVVLVHGFGGGTFTWRHVAQELADVLDCSVLAFDRPGFGLTSRPRVPRGTPAAENPYSAPYQAWMMMQLCGALGLQRVMLIGHSDGALVALMATALLRQLSPIDDEAGQTGHSTDPMVPPSVSQQMTAQQQPAVALEHAWTVLRLTESFSTMPSASMALRGFQGGNWRQLLQQRLDKESSKRVSRAYGRQTRQGESALDIQKPDTANSSMLSSAAQTHSAAGKSAKGHDNDADGQGLHDLQQPLLNDRDVEANVQQPHVLEGNHADGSQQCQSSSIRGGDLAPPGTPSATHRVSEEAPRPAVICAFTLAEGSERAEEARTPRNSSMDALGAPAAGEFCVETAFERFSGVPEIVVDSQGPSFAQSDSHTSAPPSRPAGLSPSIASPSASRMLSATSSMLYSTECFPDVCGVALLHPSLLGEVRPTFARVLANSGLGRRVLRPLLRSEIGEVSNRAAWYDHARITDDVLQLYKLPLRVKGWDEALLTVCRMRRDIDKEDLGALLSDVDTIPALIVTGLHDRIVPPHRAEQISSSMKWSRFVVLPECGHLSPEERPSELVNFIVPFCQEAFGSDADAPEASEGSSCPDDKAQH